MAPPRTKRLGQGNNSTSQAGSPYSAKDPIYANAKQLDLWHGAPGVDLDTVAASIGRSPNASAPQGKALLIAIIFFIFFVYFFILSHS
jgi:hypothetical protein